MNNDVPTGKKLMDFQREIGTPMFDLNTISPDVLRYIIYLEVKLYSLWLAGKFSVVEADESEIPF